MIGPIRDDIPIPKSTKGRPVSPVGLALDELGIGQCRFFPCCNAESVRSYVNKWGVAHQKSFITRRRTEDGKDGLRVWRTK